MTTHELKSWPEFFNEIIAGRKTHDLRRAHDRTFAIGDRIRLREFSPGKLEYTGREATVEITYITAQLSPCVFSSQALNPGFCILSIRHLG